MMHLPRPVRRRQIDQARVRERHVPHPRHLARAAVVLDHPRQRGDGDPVVLVVVAEEGDVVRLVRGRRRQERLVVADHCRELRSRRLQEDVGERDGLDDGGGGVGEVEGGFDGRGGRCGGRHGRG